jgi:leader peptidase (prepilin peptidase)/N-methyltransferase
LIKRSYEQEEPYDTAEQKPNPSEDNINHRLEVCREVLFLLPIIICSAAAFVILTKIPAISSWWVNLSQIPLISGFLGSLWGYFVGCGLVWSVRILGTLGFGKEAMGLGDVHLMGAAGAFIGPVLVVLAFFIAPFFGLAWALSQMFLKKTHQIPYGPFLSLGILAVIILHDWVYTWVYNYLQVFLYY